MKAKNIYKYLMISFIALLLGSCTSTEVDAKFDQNATERLSGRQKELNDVLLSSAEGWKAVYYTDSTQLGGWTHLFKFLPEGKVDMASDFTLGTDTDTKTYRSQYEIQAGSTASLVFTTGNRIHLLSDANNYPTAALKAKGYLGDFQFFYYGQKNGDIIFRTNRNGHFLRFVKAKAQDWTDLPKNTAIIQSLKGSATSPLFRIMETNDGTATHQFDFDYNTNARFGTASSLDLGSQEAYDVAFAFTPTGVISKLPVVVKGQNLTNFLYDSATTNFIATGTNGVSATIKFRNEPTRLTEDYKLLLPQSGNNVYAYIYSTTKSESANSALFLSLLANAEAGAGTGLFINRIQPWFNNADGTSYIEYRFSTVANPTVVAARVYHYFTVKTDATAKTVTLVSGVWKSTATAAAPAIVAPAFLKALDDQFMNPSGLYFARAQVSGYTGYTLTSTTTPFRMVLYSFQ